MAYFGIIEFCSQSPTKNILVKPRLKVDLNKISYKEGTGYKIIIYKARDCITEQEWIRIEDILISNNITHIAKSFTVEDFPFKRVNTYLGYRVKALLGARLLEYILKRNLIRSNPLYSKIGIIDGTINLTLDTIYPLVENVTDLTLFTYTPEAYTDVIEDIYQNTKLSIRVCPPNEKWLEKMDIIFDIMGGTSYLKYIQPRAVYVYIVPPKESIKHQNTGALVWNNFDVLWQGNETTPEVVEAILMWILF